MKHFTKEKLQSALADYIEAEKLLKKATKVLDKAESELDKEGNKVDKYGPVHESYDLISRVGCDLEYLKWSIDAIKRLIKRTD